MSENAKNERGIAVTMLSELLAFAAIKNVFNSIDFLFDRLIISEAGSIEQ